MLLFSEDILPSKKENSTPITHRSHTEDEFGRTLKEKRKFEATPQTPLEMPMRTVNDLQRNILYYGVTKEVEIKK